jgi:hypothetical protein
VKLIDENYWTDTGVMPPPGRLPATSSHSHEHQMLS